MRLLERDGNGGFRLTRPLPNDAISEIPPYTILSHTWGDEEVLFKDLADGTAKNKAGYAKIQFCGDQAERDGLKFFWVNTCCIDKSDSAELQHALNSMFGWYRGATKCYVYLADVSTRQQDISDSPGWKRVVRQGAWFTRGWTFQELTAPAIVRFFSKESERVEEKRFLQQNVSDSPGWKLAFRQSRWFTRGWTLQELIAPTIVEFFSKEGLRVGDKKSLEQEIHNITGIPLKALQGDPLSNFSVPERMAWIKRRDT